MNYRTLLKQKRPCPFCHYGKHEIIAQNKYAVMIPCLAPYTKDHVLVFPKRHTEAFLKINAAEMRAMHLLMQKAFKLLGALKYQDISILFREGKGSGKSVLHAHYHVIPKIKVDGKHKGITRPVLSKNEIAQAATRMRTAQP